MYARVVDLEDVGDQSDELFQVFLLRSRQTRRGYVAAGEDTGRSGNACCNEVT